MSKEKKTPVSPASDLARALSDYGDALGLARSTSNGLQAQEALLNERFSLWAQKDAAADASPKKPTPTSTSGI